MTDAASCPAIGGAGPGAHDPTPDGDGARRFSPVIEHPGTPAGPPPRLKLRHGSEITRARPNPSLRAWTPQVGFKKPDLAAAILRNSGSRGACIIQSHVVLREAAHRPAARCPGHRGRRRCFKPGSALMRSRTHRQMSSCKMTGDVRSRMHPARIVEIRGPARRIRRWSGRWHRSQTRRGRGSKAVVGGWRRVWSWRPLRRAQHGRIRPGGSGETARQER